MKLLFPNASPLHFSFVYHCLVSSLIISIFYISWFTFYCTYNFFFMQSSLLKAKLFCFKCLRSITASFAVSSKKSLFSIFFFGLFSARHLPVVVFLFTPPLSPITLNYFIEQPPAASPAPSGFFSFLFLTCCFCCAPL